MTLPLLSLYLNYFAPIFEFNVQMTFIGHLLRDFSIYLVYAIGSLQLQKIREWTREI